MTQKYRNYLNSKEWVDVKLDLFEIRGRKCERCESTKNIEVHHLHYKNIFNENPEDLEILCSDCHKEEHGLICYSLNHKQTIKSMFELIFDTRNPKDEEKIVGMMEWYAEKVSKDFVKYICNKGYYPNDTLEATLEKGNKPYTIGGVYHKFYNLLED